MKGLVIVPGGCVELGGVLELFALAAVPFLLKLAKLGGILFAPTVEAGFLKLEVAELFLIGWAFPAGRVAWECLRRGSEEGVK